MHPVLPLLALLAAAPDAPTAAPAVPLKLASPGLSGVNVAPEFKAFVTDHLGQELVLAGVEVVSSSQISAVLGLEREKQLLGCGTESDSCVTELASALGVDGLVVGTIAKLGTSLQLDVRVASAADAKNLAVYSTAIKDETGLTEALQRAAKNVAGQLSQALHRPLTPKGVQGATAASLVERRNTSMREGGKWTFFAGSALVAAGLVVIAAYPVNSDQNTTGGLLMLGGLAAMAVGGVLYLVGGTEPVPTSAWLMPTPGGLAFGLGGHF